MQLDLGAVGDTDITMPHEHSNTDMPGPETTHWKLSPMHRWRRQASSFLSTWRESGQQQNGLNRGHFLAATVRAGE